MLDENVSIVHGLEVPLYSDKLRVAGRVDCLALWKNELAIIDFKTSKRAKRREDISGYFTQTAAYAFMTYERTGMLPKQIVIMMMVDDGEPLVFVEKTRDWIESFIELRKKVDL
jgi:genome maintenance exonuclease 1